MLRTAIAPFIRQKSTITAGSACLGAAALFASSSSSSNTSSSTPHFCSVSECSAGVDVSDKNASLSSPKQLISIENVTNEIREYSSMIIPTLEALQRATRLISTAALIAADYQMNSFQRQHPDTIVTRILKFTSDAHDEVHQKHERELLELQNAVARLEKDLERAQHEYVNSDGDSKSNQSISERTLAKRVQKETMMSIANDLADAQETLTLLHKNGGSVNNLHQVNAIRLLDLCRKNGGVYIKVGQHLANLDLLLPEEYIQTLSSLFDDAPATTYSDVCKVVKEELGHHPDEIFDDFSQEPFASASLAQVHTAKCKSTGKKLAIKVQHAGLRETSSGDLLAMSTVVKIADRLFEDFNFMWICEELTPQLPKELNFVHEGKNAEAAAAHLAKSGLDCVVPEVIWAHTSERVLTMDFEEGFKATDVDQIEKAGMQRKDVARLISSVFNAQIFQNGFVHCDPHEANVLLREHPTKKGKPQIILVDHGLYKKLDEDFQEAYARLWKGIVVADVEGIKEACASLGVTKMYPLLAAMLTSRPFDEVIERSQTRSFDVSPVGGSDQLGGDKAVIRGYAQRYLKEIISMLDIVPRQMLLIFKMNDCLRHVDYALGSPANTLVVAGRFASERVLDSEKTKNRNGRFLDMFRSWLSFVHVMFRIKTYELWSGIMF